VTKAGKIVDRVLGELSGRKGFDWWWDELDPDIQVEISEALGALVDQELAREEPRDGQ
jgi:hypothetical protein